MKLLSCNLLDKSTLNEKCFSLFAKDEISFDKFFLFLEQAIIVVPSFAKLLQISSPMPRLAPVTYAILFDIL